MKTPANPGDRFIWRDPFEPILTIGPNKLCGSNSGSKKVFFFGFNRLGDFLCTTAVIHGFRKQNPEVKIIYIVQDAPYCRALEGNPDIDLVFYSNELYQLGEKVFNEKWLASLPIEIEEQSILYRFNIHEVSLSQPSVFDDHISKVFARVLRIQINSIPPTIVLSETDVKLARAFVRRPYIIISMHAGSEVVATGGRMVLKDWIFESWLQLTRDLSSLGYFDIIAIGAESDLQVQSRYYRNLYGLPIKVVAALLKDAACVITVESGISHLCHAIDASMVVIFSQYVPFAWAFPREASNCRVIYKNPYQITAGEVLSAVKSILKQGEASKTLDG